MNSNDLIQDWRNAINGVIKRDSTRLAYAQYVVDMIEGGIPPVFDLQHLSKLMDIPAQTLAGFIYKQGYFYREFYIPKRSGGKRSIAVPCPDLLRCQRWINEWILNDIEVSDCAHGFLTGRSIITNAAQHLGSKQLLKVDIKDFFPSIGINRVVAVFREKGYPPNVSFFLASLCCLNGLKDPLIFRQCNQLRDVAVLLNRGSYVEQYDRWIEARLDASERCSKLPRQCS